MCAHTTIAVTVGTSATSEWWWSTEGPGVLDGMAIDEEDALWIAVFGGWCVLCYDSRSGELLRHLELPMSNVTSCAFGGAGLDQLYITSACQGLDADAAEGYSLWLGR